MSRLERVLPDREPQFGRKLGELVEACRGHDVFEKWQIRREEGLEMQRVKSKFGLGIRRVSGLTFDCAG